jgi:hypothetical protein
MWTSLDADGKGTRTAPSSTGLASDGVPEADNILCYGMKLSAHGVGLGTIFSEFHFLGLTPKWHVIQVPKL